jgi:hypothetical protein
MLLCADIIDLVKKKHKSLRIQRSLRASRSHLSRKQVEAQSGRYTLMNHSQGLSSSFYYERDNNKKVAHVTPVDGDLRSAHGRSQ